MTAQTIQTGEFPQSQAGPEVINLGLGQPSPRLLPLSLIAEAAATQLRPDADPLVLQYGHLCGYEAFRHSLANYLSEEYAQQVSAEQLLAIESYQTKLETVKGLVDEDPARVVQVLKAWVADE